MAKGSELYIVEGTYGKGGEGDNGKAISIAIGKLTVPAALWKVIVVLPVGSDDVNRISVQTRVIAVLMPNTNAVGEQPWSGFRMSVDEIERQIGYNLLSNVPESIPRLIETKIDTVNL